MMRVGLAGPGDLRVASSLLDSPEHNTDLNLVRDVLTGSLKGHRVVLAFSDDSLVGLLVSRLVGDGEGQALEVIRVVIASEWFGRGAGAALLEHERAFAAQMGAKSMRMV